MPTRVVVSGCRGRMGSLTASLARETDGIALAGGVEAPGDRGPDAGYPVATSLAPFAGRADVLIDFTEPAATAVLVREAAGLGFGCVVGTTGLGPAEAAALADAAKRVPVLRAPNLSRGIPALLRILPLLRSALGPGFALSIHETHHARKKDRPSGTALALAEALGEKAGSLEIASFRGGDVVGDHTVQFLGEGERIEVTHRAGSREAFARGALRAAILLSGRPPGLYSFADLLAGTGDVRGGETGTAP